MRFNPFAASSTVEVAVSTDQTVYRPGDAVAATVRLRAAERLTIQEARVELVCENRYHYEEWDADGDRRSRSATDERVVAPLRLMEAGAFGPHADTEHRVAFRLPADAAPSVEGAATRISWAVCAVVAVRRARDVHAEAALAVLAPAASCAAWAGTPPESSGEACDLEVQVPTRTLHGGGRLTGTLMVSPRSDVEAQGTRVELMRWEATTRGEFGRPEAETAPVLPRRRTADPGWSKSWGAEIGPGEYVQAKLDLAGKAGYRAGEVRAFLFELTVPADACPSLWTPHAVVRWYLQGVVARRGRPDERLALELNVHNDPENLGEVDRW